MLIEVQDERRQPFHIVDKLVTWYWLPFIGQTGYALYNLYISLINYETKGAYPSVRSVAKFLGVSENTVRKYNRLLVKYGLIRIEQRRDEETGGQRSHMYYILDPPPLPEELQEEYEQQKLVDSNLLELREVALEMETEQNSPAEGIDNPPLQPLKGEVQSLKSPPSTTEEPPPQPLKPKKKNIKEKNIKTNNIATPDVVASDHNVNNLYETLQDLGVHHRTAHSLIEKYNNDFLGQVIQFTYHRLERGWQPKQSAAAWIVAAVRDNYEIPAKFEEDRAEAEQEAAKTARLQKTIEQQRQQQSEEYRKQREEKLRELDISPETEQIWQQVQELLTERGAWTPALYLAFLAEVSEDQATILTEHPVVRQRLTIKERQQAVRKALHDITGRWVKVEVELI